MAADWPLLIRQFKQAALDAVNAAQPVSVLFGNVAGVSPLRVNVEQRLDLYADDLVFTRAAAGLLLDEKVILLRVQGGQKFVVIDRIGVTDS